MKSSRDKKEQRELRKFALFLYDKPMYDKSLQAIAWKKVTRLEYYQQLLTEKELAAYLWYDFHFGDKGYPREDSIRAILNLLVERAAEYQLTMTKLFEFLFKNGMNFRQCKTQSESDVTDGKVTMVSKSMAPCNWYIRGESDIADCLWEALFATLPELDSANGPLPIMPAPGQGPSTASGFSCGVYKAANLDDLALGSTLFIASILAEAKKDDNDIRAGALLASDSMFCHMRFSPNSYLKTHKFTLHGCRDGEYDRYKDSLMYQVVLVELQEVEKLRRKEFKRQGLKDEALQSKLLLLSKKVFIILQCYNGSQEAGVDVDGKVIGGLLSTVHFDSNTDSRKFAKSLIKIEGLFGWFPAKVASMRHLFLQQKEQCQRAVGDYNNPHIMSVQGTGKALSASANWAHAAMAGSRPSCTMVLEDHLCDGIKPKMFVHRILKRVGNKITGAAADAESMSAILEKVSTIIGKEVPWGKIRGHDDVLQVASECVSKLSTYIFNGGLELMFEPHPTFVGGKQRRMRIVTEGGWKNLPRHYKPAFERYLEVHGTLSIIHTQDEVQSYAHNIRKQWSSYTSVDKRWLLDRGFDPDPLQTLWNSSFQRLCEFQSTYGHMDVHPFWYDWPITDETKRYKALYDWILKQRLRCTSKEKFAGQSNASPTPRTSEQQRIKVEHEFLLLSIGFSFNMRGDSCKLSLYRMLSMINPFLD